MPDGLIYIAGGSQFDPLAVDTFLREEELLREMTALDFLALARGD